VRFRPQRPERRLQQAAETAVVVGPEGQDIYTDEYGRIKVQFHWDREGKRNERSSCWIRVSQAWAGPTFGFQFIPRVGIVIIVTLASTQSTRRRSWAHSILRSPGFTTPSPRLVRGRIRTALSLSPPRRGLRALPPRVGVVVSWRCQSMIREEDRTVASLFGLSPPSDRRHELECGMNCAKRSGLGLA
jgi:hypothetical protein